MEQISLTEAKHEFYLQLWRGRVMACRNSGKSIAEWCRENDINIKTYYHWQKLVWNKETQALIASDTSSSLPQQTVQFAQVNLSAPARSGKGADIVIRKNAWTLEVKNSVDPALLGQILQAVTCSV